MGEWLGLNKGEMNKEYGWEIPWKMSTWKNYKYRGADKSLARPGREQATATEDFEFRISYL